MQLESRNCSLLFRDFQMKLLWLPTNHGVESTICKSVFSHCCGPCGYAPWLISSVGSIWKMLNFHFNLDLLASGWSILLLPSGSNMKTMSTLNLRPWTPSKKELVTKIKESSRIRVDIYTVHKKINTCVNMFIARYMYTVYASIYTYSICMHKR